MVFYMTHLIKAIDILILSAGYFLFIFPRIRQQSRSQFLFSTLFALYIIALFYFTLLPIIPTFDTPAINLIPFRDYVYHFGNYNEEMFLNILLFVPMGFFLAMNPKRKLFTVILYGALISLAIEILQPWITIGRVCDITDLFTNTAGTCIGAIAAKLVFRLDTPHD